MQGRINQNRAVSEDIVTLEILPREQRSCPSSLLARNGEERSSCNNVCEIDIAARGHPRIPRELREHGTDVTGVPWGWKQMLRVSHGDAEDNAAL